MQRQDDHNLRLVQSNYLIGSTLLPKEFDSEEGSGKLVAMETKKYSTGTKGRVKMHADKCKEFIHSHVPNFSLGTEFIASLDPLREETTWQRFQTPQDILPELDAWLGGDAVPVPETPAPPVPTLPRAKSLLTLRDKADHALQTTREWLASAEAQAALETQTPADFADMALRRFHAEVLTAS